MRESCQSIYQHGRLTIFGHQTTVISYFIFFFSNFEYVPFLLHEKFITKSDSDFMTKSIVKILEANKPFEYLQDELTVCWWILGERSK